MLFRLLQISALLLATSVHGASGQETSARKWSLRIADRESGAPLTGVFVSFPEYEVSRATDTLGLVTGPNASGLVQVLAAPLGYAALDTMVMVPDAGGILELALTRSPLELSTLTVEAERVGTSSRQLNRVIFNREVLVGAVGVTTRARCPPGTVGRFRG